MILEALNNYGEHLLRTNKIPGSKWASQPVYAGLVIDENGKLVSIQQLATKDKTRLIPLNLITPRIPDRTGTKKNSGFLCDNSKYLLGFDKENSSSLEEYFLTCKAKHEDVLKDIQSPEASAVRKFFENWDPELAASNDLIKENKELLLKGNNVFLLEDEYGFFSYIHESTNIKERLENSSTKKSDKRGICLVTGTKDDIERTHPKIKGIPGSQSAGSPLVSFNVDAFNSYGKEQGDNAPIGVAAAYRYTEALNYLIKSEVNNFSIGGTSLIYWAENGDDIYSSLFGSLLKQNKLNQQDTEDRVHKIIHAFKTGEEIDLEQIQIDRYQKFYILEISGNSGRLSVNSFLESEFGEFLNNLKVYHQQLTVDKPDFINSEIPSVFRLLKSSVNSKEKNQNIHHLLYQL
ncbi:type I-C CRISPR-associated protein Cas8c/Csd1 [Ileibacterium valens]|uniref:type I-C CRISPR-associated protein Cas8c/Csd1 n=1 Tax=Ileibacterium valens TaxID=1862668 RepID=UPI00259BA91B|nr:type I-C CRISPR-associated protein Cas8c/Csd1 [Ileibacterium valens]